MLFSQKFLPVVNFAYYCFPLTVPLSRNYAYSLFNQILGLDIYVILFSEADQCAENGTPCKFPMIYKGKSETSCVKNWYDIKPWCSIRVGPAGEYISDNSAWGYCKPCSET